MAFNVRIFAYKGTVQLPKLLNRQFSADSVQQLDEPYLWSQLLVAGPAAVSSAPDPTPGITLLRIEVPDQQTIRLEINPPNGLTGTPRVAGNLSPALSGRDIFAFQQGWTISIIDATNLP